MAVATSGACPADEVQVSVVVEGLPVADAGADQELTCNMGMVTLGSNNTTTDVSYLWSGPDGVLIPDPGNPFIDVGQPGAYVLTVSNAAGCTASDEVAVTANLEVPTFEAVVSEISCFAADDGLISLSNISGGQPPYQISFDGGPFLNQTQFTNLGAADYSIVVQDQNGCISELSVNLEQPREVVVTLTTNIDGENVIQLGDSVRLTAVYDPNLDGQKLTFSKNDEAIVDAETGSTWNILGEATAGELKGSQLERVLSFDHFWFAWAAFHPETGLYEK